MLLYAKNNHDFTNNAMPAWVEDWINKRTERQEKKTEKKEKPVDEAAQAKRQKAREQNVSDGVEELLLWMKDIVRNGLIDIPEKGNSAFENMARRMVDAQAPGLAGMARTLGNINFYKEGWQAQFLDQLSRIYLVLSGFKNQEITDPLLLQDVRGFIGFTQSQDALKEQSGITDNWLILTKQSSEEDNLTTERFWLYGTQSRLYALVLQFIVRGQNIQLTLTPGSYIHAELVFYPSVFPQRAIIKKHVNCEPAVVQNVYNNLNEVMKTQTKMFSAIPFRTEAAYVVENLRVVKYNEQWWLQDVEEKMTRIKEHFQNIWLLLSLSGGKYARMSLVGKENEFEPVGLWYENEYISM